MTTMDSDSESQDSDDGRRFRFEATRKDNVQPETKLGKLSKSKSEHKSYSNVECKSRKDKYKQDCNRNEHRLSRERDLDYRDVKYSAKYSKHSHESRSSRHEDSKDHRNTKDITLDARSSALPSKHKTRDSKRYRDRDRSEHRKNRSHERSRSRNENDRYQNDKHGNKSHEKYKHYSHDKIRDKEYQSYKVRSGDHGKFRGESKGYNVHKKVLTKEDEGHCLQEYFSSKSMEQGCNGNELITNRNLSVESQEYKELHLSEFDILSETDENMSDSSDIKNTSLFSQHNKTKINKTNLNNECENSLKKQMIQIEHSEGSSKVNARTNDLSHGSSNNNSGTISDSALGTISPILMEVSRNHKNDAGQRCEYESRKETVDSNSEEENFNSIEKTSLHNCGSPNTTDVTCAEKHTAYGPNLPPQLITDSSNMKSVKNTVFIGPCLPENNMQNVTNKFEDDALYNIDQNNLASENSALDSDIIFGPALPPHLLKQNCNNETNMKIIGPTLPNTTTLLDNDEILQTEFENEDAIGPLPANHPALKSNYVYRQLEERAQEIKKEQKDESDTTVNQREEWMTELPLVGVNNLGLTSRKFRTKAGPDMSDRSCWTDTPAKRAEKQKQENEKLYNIDTSTITLPKESYESEESRQHEKSLLEIHQNKLRKKKKKEEKKAKLSGQFVRRPFDRDIDLQINRLDQAQKNAFINKAQCLDERFSHGKF